MTNKIALEEHFMHPDFVDYWAETRINISPDLFGKVRGKLEDFGDDRLAAMDEAGIEKAVLSLAGPGVQAEKDTAHAIKMARVANDFLAARMAERPDRYAGFAHIAVQDPAAAADELERCMRDLGMCGAMINGQTDGTYLDDDRYSVLWERAADLGAPIYIHPNNPVATPTMLEGHPELWGPVWSWTVETGSHALRILFSGVFDRYPNAKLILGHMGETLPYQLWRFDSRWEISNRGDMRLEMPPSAYFKRNFWCTTAGVCSDAPLRCAIDALGADRVMFSVDYPFERAGEAGAWIDAAPLSQTEREQVTHANARALLKL
ncbi:amidohydrolase (plasmid) [Pacificitalea manganoxidans]|uniref:Amidohydrolase n=1 Tax=Pacificitalea manganoxidans TaxID=1411902 RepID=A0A291M4S8_9RHOB|nr:amidohydrolase family protein [Pacificitalea manganoxidans]ATI43920.1 amidohydrolase [Pacificitalea manganoxidans]MDR6310270.1 2,3-dihydroxybenzoate decarboxylase [Pacificitalea manganoxidans]